VVPGILSFQEALDQSRSSTLKLIPTMEGARKSLREVLTGSPSQDLFVFIGPEGDFTPQEIVQAVKSGFTPVSLGDSVLRAETAAIAVAAYLKFALIEPV
jgi:16S rRNA (uracil1498-N3)-methyltransferase